MATRLNVVNPALREARNDLIYPPRADFRGDFTSSIIPQQSMGSITFTRATTATVTDNDGIIRNCLSGEARFQGARRVQNLHTYSEDITNAAWTPTSCTRTKNAGIAPDGTITSGLVTSAVATALTYFNQNYDIVSGQTYILSVSLKANGGLQYVQLVGNSGTFGMGYINVDLSNGTITANVPGAANMQATVTPEANGFYRIQFKATAIATLANNHLSVSMIPSGTSARVASFPGDGIKGFYYWHPQFEDVTGQSVQTAAEYVSTNVLNSTPYHGANVDGVKYFDTDINGIAIPENTLKGFLCEGARTNIFLQSEDFSTTWGITGGGSMTTNIGIAPDGKNTMDLFIPNVTSGLQFLSQSVTTAASIYTYSIYVKASGYNFVQLWSSGTISGGYVNFDLSTGTVGSSLFWTGSIQSVGNGVYRIIATTNTVVATTSVFTLSPIATSTTPRATNFAGDGISGLLLWGVQLELGPNVSTYIPTTTTTVTRNIDVLTYNVKNVIANQGAFSAVFSMDDNEIFDRRALNLSSFTINRLHVQARTGGIPTLGIVYGDGVTVRSVMGVAAGTNNIAVAWTNGVGLNLYMNNIKYIGAFVPSLVFSTIDVGGGTLGYSLFGCIKNVRIWKTVPTDAELLALSNSSY